MPELQRLCSRIRVHEIVAALSAISLILIIRYRLFLVLGSLWGFGIVGSFLKVILLTSFGMILFRAGVGAQRDGWNESRRILRNYSRPRFLLDFARHLIVISITIYFYTWLKIFIPLINPNLYDSQLYRIDDWIHFGVTPNRFLIALFPYPWFRNLLDMEYATFHITVIVAGAWYLTSLSRSQRFRFVGVFSLLWIVGAWLYLAIPSLGPCYRFAEDYKEVRADMPQAAQFQDLLIQHYESVREPQKANQIKETIPVFGVAAFPSLHVGFESLLALWSRRKNRFLYVLFSVLTLLTFLASLISGWHYAIDGYAGVVLAAVIVWLYDKRPVKKAGTA